MAMPTEPGCLGSFSDLSWTWALIRDSAEIGDRDAVQVLEILARQKRL